MNQLQTVDFNIGIRNIVKNVTVVKLLHHVKRLFHLQALFNTEYTLKYALSKLGHYWFTEIGQIVEIKAFFACPPFLSLNEAITCMECYDNLEVSNNVYLLVNFNQRIVYNQRNIQIESTANFNFTQIFPDIDFTEMLKFVLVRKLFCKVTLDRNKAIFQSCVKTNFGTNLLKI